MPSTPWRQADQRFSAIRQSAAGSALAGVVAVGEPGDERVDDGGDRRGVRDVGLGVGHAHLERAVHGMQAQLPPPRAGVAERRASAARRRAPPRLRSAGGTPWRGSSRRSRAHRGQARVAPLVERRVGGERGDLGQVGAQGVVDGERAVGAADRDVDVQPEHELAAGDAAELGGDRS